MNKILEARNISYKVGSESILKDVNFCLSQGESMAITGDSGSGKTTLGRLIAGWINPSAGDFVVESELKRIMVDQQDHFITRSGIKTTYYSKRYETAGDDDSPSIYDYLSGIRKKAGLEEDGVFIEKVMSKMQIDKIRTRKLLQLSNGERKRTQIAAALLQRPGVLVFDQPFVGLDGESKENLLSLITELIASGVVVFIICDREHIPDSIGKVLELDRGTVSLIVPRSDYRITNAVENQNMDEVSEELIHLLSGSPKSFSEVVTMKKVNVTFGGKTILKDINWQVKNGEQWALLGHNGAGKTTLLSLITADNPQGYSNDLVLFDRKRGSGETIWDIKKQIGFVSPELHLYFLRGSGIYNSVPGLDDSAQHSYDSLSCIDVIVSGFSDEVGFVTSPTVLQRKEAEAWLSIFRLGHLLRRKFCQASLGEQRSLLLARALVKSPALLILDEPCQGLDIQQTRHFVALIDLVCSHFKTTMIYVTHIKEEIPSCVKNLLQLKKGEVAYCGDYK